jgi:hypothetical protein
MTILVGGFTDWSRKSLTTLSTFNRLSPNVRLIRDHILATIPGTTNLGGYGVREIRGGSSYSVHSWGAAQDIGFDTRATEQKVLGFLVGNSLELGVQAVHAYGSNGLSGGPGIGYIWRSNRSSHDPADGWKKQPKGGGMGESWAMWNHFETTESRWYDDTPIVSRLTPQPQPWPPFDPEHGQFSLWPLNGSKPAIAWGWVFSSEHVDATRYLQGVLKRNGFPIVVDGDFGPQTDQFVKFCQGVWGLPKDGRTDAATWARIDEAA